MDTSAFRASFPEFADTSTYPDSLIRFWLGLGEKLIDDTRAGTIYMECLCLFTAHHIALAGKQIKTAASGGSLTGESGAVSAKTVGTVSVTYDTAGAMEPGAGHWSLTIYGRQYVRLVRLLGIGCVQL